MKRATVDPNTLLALAGLSALAFGLALIYLPAALCVVGVLLIAYAILPDQKGPTP
jgi:hypothetical protein